MRKISLIATDLDGTLIGHDEEHDYYGDLRGIIGRFRREHDTVWAVCTGRSMQHFQKAFTILQHFELTPDYLILRHAYIYQWKRDRYAPHMLWNFLIQRKMMRHRRTIARTLRDWHSLLSGRFERVRTVDFSADRLCMRFSRPRDAAEAALLLREKAREHTLLSVFEFQGEIDVRVVPLTKGLALRELAERLDIPAANILSIGDGHNDLALMNPEVAAMTGCPSNAEREVIAAVAERGGHVAKTAGLRGALEVLIAYETDAVSSEYPAGWIPAEESENPYTPRKPRRGTTESVQSQFLRMQRIKSAWLLAAGLYVVALVLAHFKLIPQFRLILMPYQSLLRLISRVAEFLASGG